MVEVTLKLPDDVAQQMATTPGEIPRRILETIAAEFYRVGKLSRAQVGQLLQLDGCQTDTFLEEHGARRPTEFGSEMAHTDSELEAFRRALPELLQTDRDRFVAISNGRIVDRDADEFALAQRVAGQGQRVLIQKVTDNGVGEIHMDTPEFEFSK